MASSATAASLGSARCRTGDVRVSYFQAHGAAGSGRADFLVRNVSGVACHTFGYPGLALYNRRGKLRRRLHIARSTSVLGGTVPERTVMLRPGAAARFYLSYVEISNRGTCPLVTTVRTIMPDDRLAQRVRLRGGHGRPAGITPCSSARVSPLTLRRLPG